MAERTREFAKDILYESLLEEMNVAVDEWGEEDGMAPGRPVLFVVGAPRSGTTLLYQLLAATGAFLYPTNLMARFYRSLAWGARTQRILAPLLHQGEMEFTSRAGNTEEWWGPHEIGYFWGRHFNFREHHEPDGTDLDPLVRALGALEGEGSGPLLFKNNILSFVLPDLARALPTARFLWVRRSPLEVADSIWRTRVRFYGDPLTWWSLRPRTAQEEVPPADQIAHQVARTEEALQGLRGTVGERFAEIEYEELCGETAVALRAAEGLVDGKLDGGTVPASFPPSVARADDTVRRQLTEALRRAGF